LKGLNDFIKPAAAFVRIQTPYVDLTEKTVGEKTQVAILKRYLDKFISLDIGSAEFVPVEGENFIISCVQIKNLKGYTCVLLTMTDRSSEFKHLLRQILELFRGSMTLTLTLQKSPKHFNISEFINEIYDELKHFGVNGLLIVDRESPDKGLWLNREHSKEIDLSSAMMKLIDKADGPLDEEGKQKAITELSVSESLPNFSVGAFNVGGGAIRCLFVGDFKRDDIVFSKFRSLLTEYDQPSGYEEIIQAFARLKEDHKLIVKGERVAAILETAVAINHEINNPLTAVLGNTQLLLLQKDKLPDDVATKINTIEKSALRIRQVTQKLMTIVEPITTNYTANLDMLDIEKSSSKE
jgi:hypothetical protein